MKKTITILSLLAVAGLKSQTVAGFESFSLAPSSYYNDTNSTPFVTADASFEYQWTKGSFAYWSGGFSYTNRYDSTTAGFTNLYGVKAYRGVSNSEKYVMAQDRGVIRLLNPSSFVHGFYVTNSTYAYLAMRDGDAFCRKFGDTTGTNSPGVSQGSYPDFFKLVVRGYLNGALKTDSVEYYLADFRDADNSKDFILKEWSYVNTWQLGQVDSICFFLRSSDVGAFGMNTPAFFGIDDLTTSSNLVGIEKPVLNEEANVFPNPFSDKLFVRSSAGEVHLKLISAAGAILRDQMYSGGSLQLDVDDLAPGIYFVELSHGQSHSITKMIKQ